MCLSFLQPKAAKHSSICLDHTTLTQLTATQLYILIIIKEGEIYSLLQMINQLVRHNTTHATVIAVK